jgi:hypothetical protein
MLGLIVVFVIGVLCGGFLLLFVMLKGIEQRTHKLERQRGISRQETKNFLLEHAPSAVVGSGNNGNNNSSSGAADATSAVAILEPIKCEIQFGGKTSTRAKLIVRVDGTTLVVSAGGAGEEDVRIQLTECEVRRAPPQVTLTNCLELSCPHRKLHLNYDYLYLAFPSPRMLNVWLQCLSRWCVMPLNEHSHALPLFDR